MDGIYLIDKPEGFSSYDCIRIIKKIFLTRKVGHSGTLDPFASGLLVVLVGKRLSLLNILLMKIKYVGRISLVNQPILTIKQAKLLKKRKSFIYQMK